MLKVIGEKLRKSVKIQLNKCLLLGKIPEAWETKDFIKLYIKRDRNGIENYRQISLVSHLYRVLTKINTNRLTPKMDAYQPSGSAQHRRGYENIEESYKRRCPSGAYVLLRLFLYYLVFIINKVI